MDVLGVILGLVVAGLGIWLVCAVGVAAWGIWPAIVGVSLGVFVWRSGHDNWGILSIIVGIGANKLWFDWLFRNNVDSSDDSTETVKDLLRDIRDKLE